MMAKIDCIQMPSHLRKPRTSPEPPFSDDIDVQELWDYSESKDVGVQAQLLPFVGERYGKPASDAKVEPVSKKWHSQGSLVNKRPQISNHLPKRAKTFYISGNTNHAFENMLVATALPKRESKDDRLPVVELKPFLSSTNKEWIPAKSRAWEDEEYTTHHNTASQPYISKSADNIYGNTNGFPDAQKIETPRVADGVCSKAFPTPGERKSVHPKMKDVAEGTIIQREVSFIPKFEREKTTTEEIKQQQALMYNQYPPFSFITRELTDYDLQRQKVMRVHGQKMSKLPPHINTMYMETWQMYKTTSNKTNGKVPTKQQLIESLQSKMDVTDNTYLDENIYDHFDRTVTLPSIMVKPANCKVRRNNLISKDRNNNRPGYRLGVVNSLDVMSMCGKPLTVEQNLTSHLKHSLEQLKRTKDSSFILNNNNTYTLNDRPLSNKIEVIGRPTIGEMMIQEARRNNSSIGSQSAPVKRSKVYNTSQSRTTTYYYDSAFDDSSRGRKSTSPTKSTNRNSRLQMHQVFKENVKNVESNEEIEKNKSQIDEPPSSPVEDTRTLKQSQTEEICSVDSGELEPRSRSKSGKSSTAPNLGKIVAFEDEVKGQKQDHPDDKDEKDVSTKENVLTKSEISPNTDGVSPSKINCGEIKDSETHAKEEAKEQGEIKTKEQETKEQVNEQSEMETKAPVNEQGDTKTTENVNEQYKTETNEKSEIETKEHEREQSENHKDKDDEKVANEKPTGTAETAS